MPAPTKSPRKSKVPDLASGWRTADGTPATTVFFRGIQEEVVRWWAQHRRRDLPWRPHCADFTKLHCDPYQVWVSEVMSQQTRMDTVIRYFPTWMAAFPTVEHVAAASEDDVRKVWAGLGFYRRALMLRRGAQYVVEQHRQRQHQHTVAAGGGSAAGDAVKMPGSYAELMKVPGIGPYTAAAVASVCYGEPVASVDGNLIRVLSRLRAERGVDPKRPADVRAAYNWGQQLMCGGTESYEGVCRHPGALNQGLMEIGASICRPNGAPRCEDCPVKAHCAAFALQQQGLLPVIDGIIPMRGTRARVRNEFVVCVVHELVRELGAASNDRGSDATEPRRFLVVKRPEDGLLGGMLEFPCLVLTDASLQSHAESEGQMKCAREPARARLGHASPSDEERAALRRLALGSATTLTSREVCGKPLPQPVKMGMMHHIFSHIDMRVSVYHMQWRISRTNNGGNQCHGGDNESKGATAQSEQELCAALASALDEAGEDADPVATHSDDSGSNETGDVGSDVECCSPRPKSNAARKSKAKGVAVTTTSPCTIDRISVMTEADLRQAAPSRLCLKILHLVSPEDRRRGKTHQSGGATSPARKAANKRSS